MSLQEGDFFEGVYNLKKETGAKTVNEGSCWVAEDFTGHQRSQVIITILPDTYDPKLHWVADVQGLIKIGQSAGNNCRYFVWERGKEKSISKLSAQEASAEEKDKFVKILDALSPATHETLLAAEVPEFWHTDDHQVLFFYKKQTHPNGTSPENAEVLHAWKKIIAPAYDLPSPSNPSVVLPDPPKRTKEDTFLATAGWRGTVIAIGLLLATAAYFLKPEAKKSGDSAYLENFNHTLEKAIAFEKRGEYELAVETFKDLTLLPASDMAQRRLDSLGNAYEAYARMECKKYKSTDSPNLFFIADQYFHYAGILTGTTSIKKCE